MMGHTLMCWIHANGGSISQTLKIQPFTQSLNTPYVVLAVYGDSNFGWCDCRMKTQAVSVSAMGSQEYSKL